CGSFRFILNSFGYYLMPKKCSNKLSTNPSTPCGGITFLWLVSLHLRLIWILLHVLNMLQQTVYESVNSSRR
ncbi:hypothetical protein K443DRAFT_89551, partial [Laccaria amethystina LaAM-08-1]